MTNSERDIKKKNPRLLEIEQKGICEGINNRSSHSASLADYCFENHFNKFISWARREGSNREVATDVFIDSVMAISRNFKKGSIVLQNSAISSKKTDFHRYFWKTLKNKLKDSFKQKSKIRNIEFDKISYRIANRSGFEPNIDDNVIIEIYIYENLKKNDQKRYRTYFIEKLTHDEVVEEGILGSVRSSVTTKARLVLKFRHKWERIIADEKLLDEIRWKYAKGD